MFCLTIKEICEKFALGGSYKGCKEVCSGNINSTYKVTFVRDGEIKEYVLQRINKNVFKDPVAVMDNIVNVTHHVRVKIQDNGCSTKTGVLRAFKSQGDGKHYVVDDCGEYWRCYRFIKNSITYDSCDNLEIIERAGQAFGRFQNYLSDFDAKSLNITIPDFHNTKVRYQALYKALENDPLKRKERVKAEIDQLLAFENEACLLQDELDNGRIPYRVTHNDTKCNNVSFDKTTGEALAVLDLDTVMPGAIAHDYGDAIRFIANTAQEDCPELDIVGLDLVKFEAFCRGFVPEVSCSITEDEKRTLNLGVFTMAVELSVRFLTDYIMGDVYFKTRYPGHNLDRARNQLALAIDIKNKRFQMDEILRKYI